MATQLMKPAVETMPRRKQQVRNATPDEKCREGRKTIEKLRNQVVSQSTDNRYSQALMNSGNVIPLMSPLLLFLLRILMTKLLSISSTVD